MRHHLVSWVRNGLTAGLLAVTAVAPAAVPIDGYLPQVGITLTNEFVNDFFPFPVASPQPGGAFLGYGTPVYAVALLDSGAAVSLLTTATDDAFNINGPYPGRSSGFRGIESLPIGGASGIIEASVGDALGLYAGGLHNRTPSGGPLVMNNSAMRGQTNTSIATLPVESDLPNILGMPFMGQYATRIQSSNPQIFDVDGKTVRSPAIEFHPLGSQGMGITRKAQLFLQGEVSTPGFLPNFTFDEPWNNPLYPTLTQGGHFLTVNISNDVGSGGGSFSSQFFFDTGASVTVVSQFKALELGFDVTLDAPEFTISILGSGGELSNVPGFFVDQLTIPALGGSLSLQNVPVIVLDVTNPASPGNIVDGIVGTNVFHGRDIVIDPNPSLGGGAASPGVYISDPVTIDFQWSTNSPTGSWHAASDWNATNEPTYLSVARLHHVAGGDQQAVVTTSTAKAFEVDVKGGSGGESMELRLASGSKLTTFSGTTAQAGGMIHLDDAILDAQYVDIRPGGTLAGSGQIRTGSGQIAGQVENYGTVMPGGTGVGLLEIDGRFANAGVGKVIFDLTATGYDEMIVDGTVALAGTLEILLGGGYQPLVGTEFTLIAGTNGIGGEFAQLLLPSGYEWEIDYNEFDVTLSVLAATNVLVGDFNGDNIVDAADYLVWRNSLGSTTNLAADADGNGSVGTEDYVLWKANFGESLAGLVVAGTEVPEPATLLLVAGMMAGGVLLGRLRRQG